MLSHIRYLINVILAHQLEAEVHRSAPKLSQDEQPTISAFQLAQLQVPTAVTKSKYSVHIHILLTI